MTVQKHVLPRSLTKDNKCEAVERLGILSKKNDTAKVRARQDERVQRICIQKKEFLSPAATNESVLAVSTAGSK